MSENHLTNTIYKDHLTIDYSEYFVSIYDVSVQRTEIVYRRFLTLRFTYLNRAEESGVVFSPFFFFCFHK